MASRDDKKALVQLARKGKLDGDDGFRVKLGELGKAGITGPGHDYGLDYSERPFFRPALWEATWKNHEAICRLLIEKGATIAFADYQGRTPLHEAAHYGHHNLVELFLEKGHAIDPMDNFGQTPLYRAVEAGRDSIVELLVTKRAELNRLDTDGVTPQHVAGFSGMPDMGQWLLYKGSWKNRFSMEDKPLEYKNRATADLAKDPAPKKTMVTEVDPPEDAPEDDADGMNPIATAPPPAAIPPSADGDAKADTKRTNSKGKGAVAEEQPGTVPRSQFSDP